MIAGLLLSFIMLSTLILDRVFIPRPAYRAWQVLAIIYSVAIVLALFPELTSMVAHQVGIGRGVDLVIYLVILGLIREAFLLRVRFINQEMQTTKLIRSLAKKDVFIRDCRTKYSGTPQKIFNDPAGLADTI